MKRTQQKINSTVHINNKLSLLAVKMTCGLLILAKSFLPPCSLFFKSRNHVRFRNHGMFFTSTGQFFKIEAYSDTFQTSWMEHFAKIFNDCESLCYKIAETLKRFYFFHCSDWNSLWTPEWFIEFVPRELWMVCINLFTMHFRYCKPLNVDPYFQNQRDLQVSKQVSSFKQKTAVLNFYPILFE